MLASQSLSMILLIDIAHSIFAIICRPSNMAISISLLYSSWLLSRLSHLLFRSVLGARVVNATTSFMSVQENIAVVVKFYKFQFFLPAVAYQMRYVTNHPDYAPLTNETVLRQVGPLLKTKEGRGYRYPTQGTRNAQKE